MSQIGMSQTQLDEIELRLAGADHRPWAVSRTWFDEAGRPLICKGSRSAAKKAINASATWSDSAPATRDPETGRATDAANVVSRQSMAKHLALFKLCEEATVDMAEFVSHAPNDIETLLNEVKFLRHRYRECEKERDEIKKEMLALRVERSKLQENFSETRRVLRDLGRVIKECGGAQ